MAKKPKPELPDDPPILQIPLTDADRAVQERISLGKALLGKSITGPEALEQAQDEYKVWSDYNRDLLRKMFHNATLSEEYSYFGGAVFSMNPSFAERVEYYRDDIRKKINRLESIRGRLPLFDGTPSSAASDGVEPVRQYSRRVFVVHGHDELLKAEVARLLERLDFQAVILHEQPNLGRTVIEKFENYSDVGFAVALLTPDDVGAKKPVGSAAPDFVARARQNVIFELGFFIGRLSRDRVVALHKHGTELLSDISGVIYTAVDANGAWKLELAKELKAAGYQVDFGKIA